MHQGFRFGEYTLELDRGALLKAGNEIALRPKSYEVLTYLVRRHGELISRRELLEAVWPNVIVTDDSLTQCLVEIRRALGDSDEVNVRTVPRRGVIFEASVQDLSEPVGKRRTTWLAAVGLVIVIAAFVVVLVGKKDTAELNDPGSLPHSLAVLVFRDQTHQGDQQWLSEGIADELLTTLAQVPELRVIARTSSFSFHGENVDVTEIAERLNVSYVVEGSVRNLSGTLRISVQLVDGRTGMTLWSETFESNVSSLLSAQQSMARSIAGQILPDTSIEFTHTRGYAERSNELMLLARHYEQQLRAREDVDDQLLAKATQLYREATESDPGSAIAHSRFAGILMYQGDHAAADEALQTAMKLDPDSSEVHNNLGLLYWARGNTEAGDAFERAVDLNPNNADALHNLAHWRWYHMDAEGVAELYRRALELDPMSLSRFGALGTFLAKNGHYDEARKVAIRVQSLFDSAPAYQVSASLLEMMGDIDQAIAWTLRARNLEPENEIWTSRLAELYIDIGDFETAQAIEPDPGVGLLFKMRRYEDLIELAEFQIIEVPEDMMLRYLLGFAYMATKQYDQAVRILRSSGLPESFKAGGMRDANEADGYTALINSYYGKGAADQAVSLAQWRSEMGSAFSVDWWANLLSACEELILGNEDRAIAALRRAQQGMRLPWEPYLRDMPCLASLESHPELLKLRNHYDALKAELRRRLPETLYEFGVSL